MDFFDKDLQLSYLSIGSLRRDSTFLSWNWKKYYSPPRATNYGTSSKTGASIPELSVGPFCVTRPNPTHQLTDSYPDPTHYKWKKCGHNPTQPNTTNNGAYSIVVTYFYTKNLSCTFSQPSILPRVLYCHYTIHILKIVSLCHSNTSCSKNCLKCPQQQLRKPARSPHDVPP